MSDRRAEKLEYLQHCVTENLNHARHVENERLTFTSIYIAMVIGAVAAIFAMDDQTVAAVVATFLALFGLLSMLLNMRWQGVFDDHIHAAEECQNKWKTAVQESADPELPDADYYYGSYGKHDNFWQGLRRLVGAPVGDARAKQIRRLKWKFIGKIKKNEPTEKLEKRCKKLLGEEPAQKLLDEWAKPDKKKTESEKPAGKGLGESLSAFFKELGRTRRIFALLYLTVFIALLVLCAYLWLTEDYGGFYFTKEVIERLEEAIGLIVEETRK